MAATPGDWNAKDRLLVADAAEADLSQLAALLDQRPELVPYFRELGNGILLRTVHMLKRRDNCERQLAVFDSMRRLLRYGANPYRPQNILIATMEVAPLVAIKLIKCGVSTEVDKSAFLDALLNDVQLLTFMFNRGFEWSSECTRRIIKTYTHVSPTLAWLCATKRIYEVPCLLREICYPQMSSENALYMHPHLSDVLALLFKNHITVPHAWVDCLQPSGVSLRYAFRCMFAEKVLHFEADVYFRACFVAELVQNRNVCDALMRYMLAPFNKFVNIRKRYERARKRRREPTTEERAKPSDDPWTWK